MTYHPVTKQITTLLLDNIQMKPESIDHIVVLVKDIKRTEKFYSAFLGKPNYQDEESVMYQIRETKVFFALPYRDDKEFVFDKDRIGLNHLAFRVRTIEELKGFEEILNNAGMKHSGIQIDKYSKKEFIWFDDPDGIRLEFYLR